MFKKIFILALFITICPIPIAHLSAQENITITTYYPSPFGSYSQLETSTLWFNETANGIIAFRYPDTFYDRRLRITAGFADTGDNDQGASIDLTGNLPPGSGRLNLFAGRGGSMTFWTSPGNTNAKERMRIESDGNVRITGDVQVTGKIQGMFDCRLQDGDVRSSPGAATCNNGEYPISGYCSGSKEHVSNISIQLGGSVTCSDDEGGLVHPHAICCKIP